MTEINSLDIPSDNPWEIIAEISEEISAIQLRLLNLQKRLLDIKLSLIRSPEFTPILPLIEQKEPITF